MFSVIFLYKMDQYPEYTEANNSVHRVPLIGPIGPIGGTNPVGLTGLRGLSGPTECTAPIGSTTHVGCTQVRGPFGCTGSTGPASPVSFPHCMEKFCTLYELDIQRETMKATSQYINKVFNRKQDLKLLSECGSDSQLFHNFYSIYKNHSTQMIKTYDILTELEAKTIYKPLNTIVFHYIYHKYEIYVFTMKEVTKFSFDQNAGKIDKKIKEKYEKNCNKQMKKYSKKLRI